MHDPGDFKREGDPARILAAIVESSDDAIISQDLNGVILTWNGGAERLYGYSGTETIGRKISLLIPDGRADELPNILKELAARRRVRSHETVRVTKDGRFLDISLTISPIEDGAGRIVGASAIGRDITPQKKMETALRKSEARFRSLFESAVDGMIVIDAQGIVQALNPAAERLFGYTKDDVVGRNVNILMPSPDREEHDEYLARYLSTGVAKIIGIGRDVMGRRKDGAVFPVHLSVGEMSVDGSRSFTGILHDLSGRVQLEQRLREQHALAKLGEMAAVVAHEVKNPIAGIRGALQVITSRMPAEQRDRGILIEIIARLDALNRIVQDMLMFARPRALRHEPIALASLIADTAALIRQDPDLSALEIGVSGSAAISGDPEMLQVVFQNILMNAAQAMAGQGHIDVTISEAGANCQIAVADRGPGMPADVRENAFNAFFTTKHRGTGLGLPIARRVVEAHGGSIRIDTPPAGGTTISILLPVAH